MEQAIAPDADRLVSVNSTRTDHAHRRFLVLHNMDLCIGSVSPQHVIISDVKCVLHIPGRMMLRYVKRFKVIEIRINFWSVGNGKTQA